MFSDEIKNQIKETKDEFKDYFEKKQNKRRLKQLKAKMHDLSGRSYYEDYKIFIKDKNINSLIKSYDIKGDETLFIVCRNEQVLRSFVAVFYRLTKKVHKKTYNSFTYSIDSVETDEPPEKTALLVFEMGRYESLSIKQKEWLNVNLITLGEARKPLDMPTIILSTNMIETIKQSGVFKIINIDTEVLRKYGLTERYKQIEVVENNTRESFDPQSE